MSEINKLKSKYIKKINALETEMEKLSDAELQAKTEYLRQKLETTSVNKVLPEAFAVVREASKRTLNMRPYDVQLLGGIVLFQGKIAEMKTGEGKTLVSAAPTYLNALMNKKTHIVTVNDYLASRDMSILEPLYTFLGLTVGCITHDTSQPSRKEIYKRDVVYITNSELGFDYLRDNMATSLEKKVQTGEFSFCIIDEVDSILIDEARTPLIISAPGGQANDLYRICDVFVKHLAKEDFEVDKQLKVVMLTDSGTKKAESFFNLKNYSDIEHTLLRHHLEQSLKANYDMRKDKEYIVKENKIVLIDEHTGRIADGRRFSNGLHQALEAKEGVPIKEESSTLASITYQNFFKQYEKFSGMTGTAKTEEKEFKETYGLEVVVIPTNRPVQRKDNNDLLFVNEKAKNKAIVEDIKKCYEIGRPVLVGTLDIAKSEQLSDLLKKEGIPHHLLNAKQHELEARIVEKAGQKGAVTIATNMAGRGTDIKLGEGVRELGGLKIIASERASNRRIDNQLKGRSGRQGDPGESQFYLSFQDELITYLTASKSKMVEQLDETDTAPITNRVMNSIINKCQKSLESKHFESRKQTTKYDKILNRQRIDIYEQRDYVLEHNCMDLVRKMVPVVFKEEEKRYGNEQFAEFLQLNYFLTDAEIEEITVDGKVEMEKVLTLGDRILDGFVQKNPDFIEYSIRSIILGVVDSYWVQHLIDMQELKQDIKIMAIRGEDPVKLYTKEGYKLFQELNFSIKRDIIKNIFQNMH